MLFLATFSAQNLTRLLGVENQLTGLRHQPERLEFFENARRQLAQYETSLTSAVETWRCRVWRNERCEKLPLPPVESKRLFGLPLPLPLLLKTMAPCGSQSCHDLRLGRLARPVLFALRRPARRRQRAGTLVSERIVVRSLGARRAPNCATDCFAPTRDVDARRNFRVARKIFSKTQHIHSQNETGPAAAAVS